VNPQALSSPAEVAPLLVLKEQLTQGFTKQL